MSATEVLAPPTSTPSPESFSLFEPPFRREGVLAGLWRVHCVFCVRGVCSFCFQPSSVEDRGTETRPSCCLFAHLQVWFCDQRLVGFLAEPLLLPFGCDWARHVITLPVRAVRAFGKANERVRPSYRKSVGLKIDRPSCKQMIEIWTRKLL